MHGWKDFHLKRARSRDARSVGQRLTYKATGAPQTYESKCIMIVIVKNHIPLKVNVSAKTQVSQRDSESFLFVQFNC